VKLKSGATLLAYRVNFNFKKNSWSAELLQSPGDPMAVRETPAPSGIVELGNAKNHELRELGGRPVDPFQASFVL
jgi:hypothetical protein